MMIFYYKSIELCRHGSNMWLEDKDTKKRLYYSEAKVEGGHVYFIRFPKKVEPLPIAETQVGMQKEAGI